MSKLSELIAELCPDGVEYLQVQEVVNIKPGRDYKHLQSGNIPVYGSGGIMTYVDEFSYNRPTVLLPRKGSISNVFYVDEPFWNVDTIYYTEIDETKIMSRFFYHVMCHEHIEKLNTSNAARPALTREVLNKIKIPVPPLEVQREIVRILDTFAETTKELAEKLNAELIARRKQYEYYRDLLLTFDDAECPRGGDTHSRCKNSAVRWMKLGDIAEIGTGSSNTNEGLEEGNYPFFVRSQDVRWKNEYEFDETAIITSGDGVGVGKIFHFVEGKYALHQRAYRIRISDNSIMPKFFFYYIRATFLSYIEKASVRSSVTSIRRPMLNNFSVPVPPLSEQRRIVSILDRFDALCHDITAGLPAEVAARRKQYEYYRDKLLTFKEKTA